MKWIVILVISVCVAFGAGYYIGNRAISSGILSPLGMVTPKPLLKYTIENLSRRQYVPTQIILDGATATTSAYTVYAFHYISDGLKVTGVAHIPNDASPVNKKPVIVEYRGFIDPANYFSGDGTAHSAEVYAQNGFITLAPDFLGFGGSDKPSGDVFEERFQTYTTAVNLLVSVGSLSMVDASRVGVWGHSNGGHIALTVSEIVAKPYPLVLWAPVSKPFPYSILYYTDDADDHGKLLRKELAAFEKLYDVELFSLTNYLDRVQGPIQLHQWTADNAVPLAWSDALASQLKGKGKDVTYYTYSGADHDMTGSWNTVVARDVAFYTKYLK